MDSKLVSSDDTICAICTPDGVGSLAVIRISGPKALDITKEIFKPKNTKTSFKPNMTNLGNIYYKEKLIDQGIGIYFKSPNSLTGQDVVELQTHGGYVVPKMVLKALLVAGARLAEPGEFSFRSFLNGKIDLLEAEGIADLISSQSEAAANYSTKNISGEITKKFNNLRDLGINLLAELEARVDFPEDEISEIDKNKILEDYNQIKDECSSIFESYDKGRLIMKGLRVLILGEPNVGKSTLLNAILNEERSIVTNIPGTTRDIVEAQIDFRGHRLSFSDTAGQRISKDIVETAGIQKAKDKINYSDAVLIVTDKSDSLSDLEKVFSFVPREKIYFVLNKSDLISERKLLIDELKLKKMRFIEISAKESTNIRNLLISLLTFFVNRNSVDSDESVLTTERQVNLVKDGIKAIERSRLLFANSDHIELVTIELRFFLEVISKITGEIHNEDIYDILFSKFCIGK